MKGINHIAIVSKDPEKLSVFYNSFLGLVIKKTNYFDNGTVRSVWLDIPGSVILMIEIADYGKSSAFNESVPFQKKVPGLHLIAFSIDKSEMKQWKCKLDSSGVRIEHFTDYSIYFFDPDGNRLALSCYGETG